MRFTAALRSTALVAVWMTLSSGSLSLQAQPGTDIYLGALTDGGPGVEGLTNITRRPGYDNQPQFTADGTALLYTSIREDGQADTYRYRLATGSIERVTRTPESEYSPTPIAGGFSAVRVEMDSTQRLWRFDHDGSDPELLLPNVRPVGYHAWADPGTVVLYVLGEPPTLQVAEIGSGGGAVVAQDVGRSVQAVPGARAVSFVQRISDDEAWIAVLRFPERTIERRGPTRANGEDHAWTPDGRLLMGEGSRLYLWDPARGGPWHEIADLSPVREISRIAVSRDGRRIAIVGADPEGDGGL